MTTINEVGNQIIAKVKDVFVFGPGNAREYPELFASEDLEYKRWAEQIRFTGRFPVSLKKTSRLSDAQKSFLKASSTTVGDYTLVPVGENMVIFSSSDYARAVGSATAARIGNCMEHALMALYFCAQLNQNGDPLFKKLTLVRLGNEDHSFAKCELMNGDTIYIDPWKRECYPAADFAKHNNGQTENILLDRLTLFADPNIDRAKHSKRTSLSGTIDEFAADCKRWTDIYLIAANVPPEHMDEHVGRYIFADDPIAKEIIEHYKNPNADQTHAQILLYQQVMYDEKQQKQLTAKKAVTNEINENALIKKIGLKTGDGKTISVLNGNKCDLSAEELFAFAVKLYEQGKLNASCRIIFSNDKPLISGTQSYKSINTDILKFIVAERELSKSRNKPR